LWLKLLTVLFDLLDQAGQYFARQQLLDAGKAEQKVAAQQEIESRVEQANQAVTVPDAARTERLRKRFDDAS
jgi:hypothetical protein